MKKQLIQIDSINALIKFRKTTQQAVSEALGMSRRNLNNRLNDPKMFRRTETDILFGVLSVSPEQLEELINGRSINL